MPKTITVALAGNPNAGKTTIFNAITGARQHVGNWPGVTVEKKEGSTKHNGREIHVVDLPGTYSLTAYSLEEIIARNFVIESSPDVVVDVVDASNLERNLYLAVQLLEMEAKVVIALNMIDVAKGRNIAIDHQRLSALLGVPVIPTNGKKGIGIEELVEASVQAAESGQPRYDRKNFLFYGTEVEDELAKIEAMLATAGIDEHRYSSRWLALKLLEGDSELTEKIAAEVGRDGVFRQLETSRRHLVDIFDENPEILLTDSRYGFISGTIKPTVQVEDSGRVHLSETVDTVLTHRLFGPIVLFVVLYVVYSVTFQGGQPLVELVSDLFKSLGQIVASRLPEGLFKSLIVSGVINGAGGVLGFTPLIALMFMVIAILEDTGYMARIAFMLDRVLRGFGLHGSSMLALIVSGGIAGGCAVPGIMATRTMKEPKERLVTILVAPLMNCGAKMPVYALLIGAFFTGSKAQIMLILTLISWAMALMAGKIIRSTVLSGPSAPFVLELPPYRVPTLRGILIHTWERTWMYIKKAGTVILAISILLWAMMTFPELSPELAKPFDQRTAQLTADFLADPQVAAVLKSEEDLDKFEQYLERFRKDRDGLEKENPAFYELAGAVVVLEEFSGDKAAQIKPRGSLEEARLYVQYSKDKKQIEAEKQGERLKHTAAGRIGVALETVFKPMGFDWRTNVALIGGFAAKEVVVATLGTAYSLGEVDPKHAESLSEQLKKEPNWNPLTAFTLIMFVMLYNPCLTTLAVIKKESGKWRWVFFAMVYTTTLAYCVALVVHVVGAALRLGV